MTRVAQDARREYLACERSGVVSVMAPAKVNLFLEVGHLCENNYHEVTTIMHALMLHDVVHMEREKAPLGSGLVVEIHMREHGGVEPFVLAAKDNIAVKALVLFSEALDRCVDEKITIHIEKNIPAQAGLGGGSSDAAAVLIGAARLWGLGLCHPLIEQTAQRLGADVPFFLRGGCACFTGVGDIFDHSLKPAGSFVVLVKPKEGVATQAAYRAFDNQPYAIMPTDKACALAAEKAVNVPLRNNLVHASESILPLVAEVGAWLGRFGGLEGCLMSGSGSTLFARAYSFKEAQYVAKCARAQGWWARATMLCGMRVVSLPGFARR